jgi:hypothetical protein
LARKALQLGGVTGTSCSSLSGKQLTTKSAMDALQEHATKIEGGSVNSIHARICGVKEQPLFDEIDTDHFIPPVIHPDYWQR